jgi:hypothetical protein
MSEIKPRSTELYQLTPVGCTCVLFFQLRSFLVFFSVFIILTLSKSDVDPPASSNGRLRTLLFPTSFSDIFPYGATFPALFPRSHHSLMLQSYFLLHRKTVPSGCLKIQVPSRMPKRHLQTHYLHFLLLSLLLNTHNLIFRTL